MRIASKIALAISLDGLQRIPAVKTLRFGKLHRQFFWYFMRRFLIPLQIWVFFSIISDIPLIIFPAVSLKVCEDHHWYRSLDPPDPQNRSGYISLQKNAGHNWNSSIIPWIVDFLREWCNFLSIVVFEGVRAEYHIATEYHFYQFYLEIVSELRNESYFGKFHWFFLENFMISWKIFDNSFAIYLFNFLILIKKYFIFIISLGFLLNSYVNIYRNFCGTSEISKRISLGIYSVILLKTPFGFSPLSQNA